MSINPVQGIGPANETRFADANPRPAQRRSSPPEAVGSDPGTPPKQEVHHPQTATGPIELPQDEVQVQRDSQTNGEIVIRYLNGSGNVILQVPSSQVLGVTRAIDEDFQQEAKAREIAGAAQAGTEGGKTHGH